MNILVRSIIAAFGAVLVVLALGSAGVVFNLYNALLLSAGLMIISNSAAGPRR